MIQHILNQPSAKLFSMVQGTPALYNPFRRLSVTIKNRDYLIASPGFPYLRIISPLSITPVSGISGSTACYLLSPAGKE